MDNLTVCSLISNDSAVNVAKQLEFDPNSGVSQEYSATVRLAEVPQAGSTAGLPSETDDPLYFPSFTALVRASLYPRLLDSLGSYVEMSEELVEMLNTDFRLYPDRLMAVPDLFTGCLIQGSETLFVLTNEVYSRHFGMDVHAEPDGETLPDQRWRYTDISCGIYKRADSGKPSTKLIIGSKSLNVLVTASTTLSASPVCSVGPSTRIEVSAVSSSTSKIYLLAAHVHRFKASFQTPPPKRVRHLSKLRQVTSSLHNRSSYASYRATLKLFDDELHQPVTLFTLCDLPNSNGYGCSEKSYTKLTSKFLQICATKVMVENTRFDISDFHNLFLQYQALSLVHKIEESKDESAASRALRSVIEACQHYLKEHPEADIMDFARSYSFSPLAATVSSSVSKANKKVFENIFKRLLSFFG